MKKAKRFLVAAMASMMMFSTVAYGITYKVTQNKRGSNYVVTKNGTVSSFSAIGTTGDGAYCRTGLNNTYDANVKLTVMVKQIDKNNVIISTCSATGVKSKAHGITTSNMSRAYNSNRYKYRHLAEAYTSSSNAYDILADVYQYTDDQTTD